MRFFLKTALFCSVLSLFAAICLAEDLPLQGSSAVPRPAIMRVLITDCVDRTPDTSSDTGPTATGLLYVALDRYGKQVFDVISWQEVWAAAERLGLPSPETTAPSGHWKEEDKLRLCKALNAELLCDAQVRVDRNNPKLPAFTIALSLRDITLQIPRSNDYSVRRKKSLPTAITLGIEDVAQECIGNLLPSARVLDRTGTEVALNLGLRNGVKVGDGWIILREVAGKKIKVGKVEVIRCHPTDSEATVIIDTGGIQAGDTALTSFERGCIYEWLPRK